MTGGGPPAAPPLFVGDPWPMEDVDTAGPAEYIRSVLMWFVPDGEWNPPPPLPRDMLVVVVAWAELLVMEEVEVLLEFAEVLQGWCFISIASATSAGVAAAARLSSPPPPAPSLFRLPNRSDWKRGERRGSMIGQETSRGGFDLMTT